jgi:hypothetical protein
MSYRTVRQNGSLGAEPVGPASGWLLPVVISAGAVGVMAILLYLDRDRRLTPNEQDIKALKKKYHEEKAYTYSYCPTCEEEEKHQVLPKQYGAQQKLTCLECGSTHREVSDYESPQRPWDFGLSSLPKAPRPTRSAEAIRRAVLEYEGYQLPETAPGKFGQRPQAKETLGKGVVTKLVGEIPLDMSKKEFMSLLTIRSLPEKAQAEAWKKFKTRETKEARHVIEVPTDVSKEEFFEMAEIRALPINERAVAWDLYQKKSLSFPWKKK